jgi:carbon monoxide dehydrogenase subunit G
MKLHNEFFVQVPIERAWETLLDIETVAGFLPGAKIEPGGADGVYEGSMKVKVGPMTVNYQGAARLASVDEQSHVAEIEVRAKEAKGQGTAAAVIRNMLTAEDGGTRVSAETDLQVTGRQAQFGRGIMQDVAGRMLNDFAGRFEAYLTNAGAGQAGAVGAADSGGAPGAATATPAASEDALDLGSVVGQMPIVRYGVPALVVALLIVLLVGSRSRSRGIRFGIDF